MQKSVKEIENEDADSVGVLDTSPVATELPTILRVDGSEYEVTDDSNTEFSEQSPETVEIEAPCMYCDTKNKLQYSGRIPSLVSCTCSHCGEEIEIVSKSESEDISVVTLVKEIESYQKRRIAYIAGQSMDRDVTSESRKLRILTAVFSFLGIGLMLCTFPLMNQFVETISSPLFKNILLSVYVIVLPSVVVMLMLSEGLIYPKLLSWYLDLSFDLDHKTVTSFLEGHRD
jgi:hypothetical protein